MQYFEHMILPNGINTVYNAYSGIKTPTNTIYLF